MTSMSDQAGSPEEKFLWEFFARQMEFSASLNGPLDDIRKARVSARHLVRELKSQDAVRKALLTYLQE